MKQKSLGVIAIFEGLILFGLLASNLGWLGFFPNLPSFGCGGEIYATAQSPDKSLTAYAFERDCGATTDSMTFLILRDSNEKLDLAKDLDVDEIVFSAEGSYHPQLRWPSKDNLHVNFDSISAPKTADINFQVVKQGDVAVEYHGLK